MLEETGTPLREAVSTPKSENGFNVDRLEWGKNDEINPK